jgi:hypothetical protein
MAAITAAAIGAAGAIYSANKASKDAKANRKLGQEAIDAADPFRQYRPQYAERLNALMSDPSSIQDTPEYKARVQAAQRQLAAQGYTGSGNALVEVANAGGVAYQQAFDNLAMLSGANTTPGGGYQTAAGLQQGSQDQQMSALAGITNNFSNLALTIGQKFNQPGYGGTPGTTQGGNAVPGTVNGYGPPGP